MAPFKKDRGWYLREEPERNALCCVIGDGATSRWPLQCNIECNLTEFSDGFRALKGKECNLRSKPGSRGCIYLRWHVKSGGYQVEGSRAQIVGKGRTPRCSGASSIPRVYMEWEMAGEAKVGWAAARDRGHGSTAPVARVLCPSRWRFFQPAHGTATARAITPTARGNTAVTAVKRFWFVKFQLLTVNEHRYVPWQHPWLRSSQRRTIPANAGSDGGVSTSVLNASQPQFLTSHPYLDFRQSHYHSAL
ncbi:hypothetical protein C8R45DRAFT_928646 [Mycena sanguinolenta]|nr:hypothetical protein C8R45DRAFT_928646 [Mycena sanguinolenta]